MPPFSRSISSQFDALLELLTVREHLELYARIKGVPSDLMETVVMAKMHEMNIAQFENRCAGTLSGGNKRKLSVAVAMIGAPKILFLDEPSTGAFSPSGVSCVSCPSAFFSVSSLLSLRVSPPCPLLLPSLCLPQAWTLLHDASCGT